MPQDHPAPDDAAAAPAVAPKRRRLVRVVAWVLGGACVLALGLVAAGYAMLRYGDIGPFVAARASAKLGRAVTLGAVHAVPGRWTTVEIEGVTIPSIPGGSGPPMVTLRRATAEVDVLTLLHGPVLLRNATVDGLSVLLERTADRTPNWRFKPPPPGPAKPADRSGGFPSLRTVRMTDLDIVYRTTSGNRLVTHLDQAAIETPADDQPVHLTGKGAYNGTPVSLDADLGSLIAYRDTAAPFPTTLHLASGDVMLTFEGTMTAPLDVDGAKGTLTLDAESPGPLFAIAGVKSDIDAALHLTGDFERQGDLWRLSDAFGALDSGSVMSATLRLHEGGNGRPDDVQVALEFDRLDLNNLIGAGARGKRSGADMPLNVERAPDTLVKAKLSARDVVYGDIMLSDALVEASLTEGKVAVERLDLTIFGIRVRATGRIEAEGSGGRVTAEMSASGGDVQGLRRRFGFAAVPLAGRLDGQFAVHSTGKGLNEAVKAARVSALVVLKGGSISKELIEKASTDVRALFRSNKGMRPVSCLLAGLDMRAGVGTLAPLRVRAAEGTIAGSARFDLNRKVLDLTIGSEAGTTGFFALDIPVRVSGAFASPDVRPATWTPQGKALLAAADDLGQLPPALREMARRNPCPPSGKR